jgi:hypothetical protein
LNKPPSLRVALAILVGVAALAGCRRVPETEDKSAATQLIEDMTGKTAVDARRRAEEQIRKVSAEHNQDLDQVMGK